MGCTGGKSGKKQQNDTQQAGPNSQQPQNQNGEGQKQPQFTVGPELFISVKKQPITQEYKLGELLGEGAFGSVRIVKHKSTGLSRAMKSIKKSNIIKEEEERMFSEVSVLKSIDHPNIIKLFELYQDDTNYYLITEYQFQ